MTCVFGEYALDTRLYQLRREGKPLKVEPKVFNVLVYLVQQRGSVVSKQELLEHVWPDRYITAATLSGCVMAARKAVGDSGSAQRVIQTLHGRGYRLVPAMPPAFLSRPSRGLRPRVPLMALPSPIRRGMSGPRFAVLHRAAGCSGGAAARGGHGGGPGGALP
jgi:Transcriptional regulatory protein, C terminal